MADSDHSSDTDMCTGATGQENSKNNKPEFSEDVQRLIQRTFNLLGDRWSLIAGPGRIPGRTAEEIEKCWTHAPLLHDELDVIRFFCMDINMGSCEDSLICCVGD